jgi:hypothetical protein
MTSVQGHETLARVRGRKRLRAPNAKPGDIVQVCFQTTDRIWNAVRATTPPELNLQQYVTFVLEKAVPDLDARKAPPPPSVRVNLDDAPVAVRCFKTKRMLWAQYVWWAAMSGLDLKELISRVLWQHVLARRKGTKSR